MKRKNAIIVTTFVLALGLVAAINLSRKNQDTRRGAAFASGEIWLLPDTKVTIPHTGNSYISAALMVDPKGKTVTAINTFICFNDSMLSFGGQSAITANAAFDQVIAADTLVDSGNGKKCVDLTLLDTGASLKATGPFEAARINFKTLKTGTGSIDLLSSSAHPTKVMGANPNNSDKEIAMNITKGSVSYETTPSDIVIIDDPKSPYLNFKVSFAGVRTDSSDCAVDWKVKVTVMNSTGTTKSFENVPVTKEGSTANGLAVFKGGLRLNGFNYNSNIAVLIKGPKHAQQKFGQDKQTVFYNQYVGKINLSSDQNSPAFDFTGLPVMPGDIAKEGSQDGQDGWTNSNDFAYLKNKVGRTPPGQAGHDMAGDLDGNCVLNSNDINLLKVTMSQISDQLY